jgi:peptidylprolyl isomerase/peptidyl-prolyl cis-trans isomerase A (cyclophilin A)
MDKFWQISVVLTGVLVLILVLTLSGKTNTSNQIMEEATQQATTTGQQSDSTTIISTDNLKQTTAVFTTNQGTFSIQLETEKAPNTAANFIKLAQTGFYNGQRFHRVIEGFMIQGGDPLSKDVTKKMMWGTGGPGYQFNDEFGQGLSNVTGTISMANAGPNTNGSQFFINTNDNVFLDGKHAVFGKVVDGMDVVMKISQVQTDPTDKPVRDVIIEKVEIK